MGKYGLRIKNVSAGMIYDVNLGVRDYFTTTDAVFHNSLFSTYIRQNGLRTYKDESTRDIVCISFDFGSRSYEEEAKRLDELMADADEEQYKRLAQIRERVEANKDKYCKKTREEIREIYYRDGVDITWNTRNKDGEIKKQEVIHYNMLYRTSAKAKLGEVMFINSKLYKKARQWLTMNLADKLPADKAKIVELSAYAPLTTSTIVDEMFIPVDDILILRDQDSLFRTLAEIVTAEEYMVNPDKPDERKKRCVVKRQVADIKNTLWDGMALLSSDMFPVYGNGMMLIRNHFFKACCFRTNIQMFFRDWCAKNGQDYETYIIFDMFGAPHRLRDIKMITTDNAIKWKKFVEQMGGTLPLAYEYWKNAVKADGNMWGVVKTDHISKLGRYQQLSYQMLNTLPCDEAEMGDILQETVDYVVDLKRNPETFAEFLQKNANAINNYEMLLALYRHNPMIAESKYFRDEKSRIIKGYVKRLRTGKIMVDGDNLTMCGNPYALLLYSVGEDWRRDPTLSPEDGTIQCYTTRFEDGEYLCAFRSPHNSPNNACYLHNVYSAEMKRYFPFSNNILAVNNIGTDIQSRLNGCDYDSDFVLVTNQPTMVECARRCYRDYPTIVNDLRESGVTYGNTMEEYARMDNTFAKSQLGIGWSSNLAQLAMTYYWTEAEKPMPDERMLGDLKDCFIILSVLAQVIIDGCKRVYEIDGMEEIKRIQKLACMQRFVPSAKNPDVLIRKDFPQFMRHTRTIPLTKNGKERQYDDVRHDRKKLASRIDHDLVCPMNWVNEYLNAIPPAPRNTTIPTGDFFIKASQQGSRKQMSKIRELADSVNKWLVNYTNSTDDEKENCIEILTDTITDVVGRLRQMNIGNDATINRLIEISLGIADRRGGLDENQFAQLEKNSRIIMDLLFRMDRYRFLSNFKRIDAMQEEQVA